GEQGVPDRLVDQPVHAREHRSGSADVFPAIVPDAGPELGAAEIDRVARAYSTAAEHRRVDRTQRAGEAAAALGACHAAAELAADRVAEGVELRGKASHLVDQHATKAR